MLAVAVLCAGTPDSLAFTKKKKRNTAQRLSAMRALRARKMAQVFVASTDLRPMAQQLLQARTAAAYAGVERYAQSHAGEDSGALADFVLGYAHVLDLQYSAAIPFFKKAQPRSGELGDYVDYFLASSQGATGAASDVISTLQDFDKRHPDSLFARDAAVVAANALLTTNNPHQAVTLLAGYRTPAHPDVELTLGRAEQKLGNTTNAVTDYRRVFYELPMAPEAEAAKAELQKLAANTYLPSASSAQRKSRAAMLLQNRRAGDAVTEYRGLLHDVAAEDRPAISVMLAHALLQDGQSRQALDVLRNLPELPGEVGAQRLYYMVELSRQDQRTVADLINRLRSNFPQSNWFQEALFATANMYLLQKDYSTASRFYGELASRFPEGSHAAYANWKSAWLQLRLGDVEQAKQGFERQIAIFPNSAETSAALYWRGRLSEEENNAAKGRAFYAKGADRYRNDYYAELSRERLRSLGINGEAEADPLLDRVKDVKLPVRSTLVVPEDNLRVQKSMLLQNCGMTDFAIRELQAAGSDSGVNWVVGQVAELFTESGRPHRALQFLKRAVPGYYSFDEAALPHPFWESLFPRPYWEDLKRNATENRLDPFLVASLIRQESEFNAGAISRASAIGLMQLLPGTGKKLAKETKDSKLRRFDSGMLLDPAINLELGMLYLRRLLDKYDGQVEYALAAYNAGPERVDDWRNGKYRDVHEFVESIPFTETREYVEAIMRNRLMYQQLYHTP